MSEKEKTRGGGCGGGGERTGGGKGDALRKDVNPKSSPRELTAEEAARLGSDTDLVSAFRQVQLEREAKKNWDLFYKRNGNRFYKDRHWTLREFLELGYEGQGQEDKSPLLLELGAGVGNFLFPLIEEGTSFYVFACDFSDRAIALLKSHPLYDEAKSCKAFVADASDDLFVAKFSDAANIPVTETEVVDVVSLIFVLSAVHPDKMLSVIKNVFKVLRIQGLVVFRDYGLNDHAMLRFGSGHKLGNNFYVRQDGTRAYYFTVEFLESLFIEAGFETVSNNYVSRETVNKKEGLNVPRVFVQSKFKKRKPL